MRKQMTNNELMILDKDISELTKNSPALSFFFSEKIKRFYEANQVNIRVLYQKIAYIKKQHCVLDEKGEPLTVKSDEGLQLQYESDEKKEQCAAELTEFLNRAVWATL